MKIHPKSLNVARVGPPGKLLGVSWDPLGVLGPSGGPLGRVLGASWGVLGASWWPSWFQLSSQKGTQIDPKSKQKSINFWMPLGIGFLKDFGGFWRKNKRKLASGWHQKSLPTSKGHFFKKPDISCGKAMILKVLEIEVGSKNQSKINQNLKPKMDGLLASIFAGFCLVLGSKLAPQIAWNSISRGIKKEMPKSKHLGSDFYAPWKVSGASGGGGTTGRRFPAP